MRLTEVHSRRIQSVIYAAINQTCKKHSCEIPLDNDDDEHSAVVSIKDLNVDQLTQHILLGIQKLEAELSAKEPA